MVDPDYENEDISRDEVRRIYEHSLEEYDREQKRVSKTVSGKKARKKLSTASKSRSSKRQTSTLNGSTAPDSGHTSEIKAPTEPRFKFIDLFAGIGGFRIPLQALGGQCVFSSEIDKFSQQTYKEWFGEEPSGDITGIPLSKIPDHDILAGGFPCQPFSIAGVSKKNSLGRPHGFDCDIQGTLFFNIAKIVEHKRPSIVLLENVKNLRSHDRGRTWGVIKQTLQDLEYKVFDYIIDAASYVPQHRERIYIVCFDTKVFGSSIKFEFPKPPKGDRPKLKQILESNVDDKYTLSDHLWGYLQDYAKKHRDKGNGFGFGLPDFDGVSRTLSARYHKDGAEILIAQDNNNPRRLTPRECARLMGFPDHLPIVVSDTQAYRQFGNAVVPKVVAAIAKQIMKTVTSSGIDWPPCRVTDECAAVGIVSS